LTGDRLSNLYTISLNEVASNSTTCLLAKASSSQSWLWHQRLSHLNFATINNLVKNNHVQSLPKMKFEKDHLCSVCEQGKIHQKHHKSKTAFASNKPLYLLHMDLCGPMRVQSINGKRYVLVIVDDYSRYTWVFFLHSKDEASKVIISFIKKTQVNLQLQVQHVRTDNDTEFKNKTLAKFFDEDVGKLKVKGDIRVFVGYSKESAAFRIYNKQPRKIHESVNVNFDEISKMASKQFSLEPGLYFYDEYFDSSKIMKSSTTNVETPSAAFRIYNKRTRKIHESVNVNFDEISEMASKQFSLEPGLSKLNETGKSSNPFVSKVDEASKKDLEDLFQDFYDEYFDSSKIMKSSTTNVETPINDEVFHEVSESFQGESSSSSLNDDVQQSPEEVIPHLSNTQSISINMVPNGDEASTSHNVFNERLEDAYFDVILQVDEASKKYLEDLFQDFYDEYFDSLKIMKSSTTNVETLIIEEVFHEVSESFQGESSSSSLNDDVQQSLEEVILPQTNTQSIPINMITNGDEVSTSHNVFNERLEDAYFDVSTSFYDPSNVQTFYQPYPHEKKWTKDHPLHKIISDPKSSVQTRVQLANSCLFSCLLSSIEPANVAEALRDGDWVSAMQEELDQFSRLKVWRLVPRPEGKSVIKTKWIFKNKKDESSLVIRHKARLVAVGYSQQ
nr:retrovirus-related Pol polyprotein from transposon TNT 1-94 [Tanacetum cinerariifolium]